MKARQLEQLLSSVKPFARPKAELEQYATDAHVAARMIYTACTTFGDVEGGSVLDLGCGCGMLGLASILMGAKRVVGVDIDADALAQCQNNMEALEVEEEDGLELIHADVLQLHSILRERFDTVILNPPFGTKDNAGIDMAFLQQALNFSRGSVYSLHKTATREYIVRRMRESFKVNVRVLAQIKFEIPHQFSFHKKERVFVEVDLIRLEHVKEKD